MKIGIATLLALLLLALLWHFARGPAVPDGGGTAPGARTLAPASDAGVRLEGGESSGRRTSPVEPAPPRLEGAPPTGGSGTVPKVEGGLGNATNPGVSVASHGQELSKPDNAFFESKYAQVDEQGRRQASADLLEILSRGVGATEKGGVLTKEEYGAIELELRWLEENPSP